MSNLQTSSHLLILQGLECVILIALWLEYFIPLHTFKILIKKIAPTTAGQMFKEGKTDQTAYVFLTSKFLTLNTAFHILSPIVNIGFFIVTAMFLNPGHTLK